jgi:hypothetical protein
MSRLRVTILLACTAFIKESVRVCTVLDWYKIRLSVCARNIWIWFISSRFARRTLLRLLAVITSCPKDQTRGDAVTSVLISPMRMVVIIFVVRLIRGSHLLHRPSAVIIFSLAALTLAKLAVRWLTLVEKARTIATYMWTSLISPLASIL